MFTKQTYIRKSIYFLLITNVKDDCILLKFELNTVVQTCVDSGMYLLCVVELEFQLKEKYFFSDFFLVYRRSMNLQNGLHVLCSKPLLLRSWKSYIIVTLCYTPLLK